METVYPYYLIFDRWMKELGIDPANAGNYLILDIETTSLNLSSGRILQIGVGQVMGHQLAGCFPVYLKTPDHILDSYMQSKYVQQCMASGKHFVHADTVRSKGKPPEDVFRLLKELVDLTMGIPGSFVAGHNVVRFDVTRIELWSQRSGYPIKFDRSRLLDTAAVVKGVQLDPFIHPDQCHSMAEWSEKVLNQVRKGLYWSLGDHCYNSYGLTKYADIDVSKAHSADTDCRMTHYLLQEMLKLYRMERDAAASEQAADLSDNQRGGAWRVTRTS